MLFTERGVSTVDGPGVSVTTSDLWVEGERTTIVRESSGVVLLFFCLWLRYSDREIFRTPSDELVFNQSFRRPSTKSSITTCLVYDFFYIPLPGRSVPTSSCTVRTLPSHVRVGE